MKTGRPELGKLAFGSEKLAQTFPLRSRCFEADAIRKRVDREKLLDEGNHGDIFPVVLFTRLFPRLYCEQLRIELLQNE